MKRIRRTTPPTSMVEDYRAADMDYTPPSRIVRARGVRVRYAMYQVEIEEHKHHDGTQYLDVGVMENPAPAKGEEPLHDFEKLYLSLSVSQLDELIFSLSFARDEARRRNMPNLPEE